MRLFTVILGFSIFAQASEFSFNALCELKSSSNEESTFASQPFAKLFASQQTSQFFTFDDKAAAQAFGGYEGEQSRVQNAYYEKGFKKRKYTQPRLEEARRRNSSALVFWIPGRVFNNLAQYKIEQFELQAELRDYDNDYSGWFFLTHGYALKDQGVYRCRIN